METPNGSHHPEKTATQRPTSRVVDVRGASQENLISSERLNTPAQLRSHYPLSRAAKESIATSRVRLHDRLQGHVGAPLAIVGPCSVHCETAALEYAERLLALKDRIDDRVQVAMRVYFEKPRTTVGWKGFLYDPDLDGSEDLARGLRRARALLVQIAEMGLPIASEVLDPIAATYLSDCFSWVAVGARTSESQIHRQMASELDCPVGFKNGTDGNVKTAVQAIQSARSEHTRLGINEDGQAAIHRTRGNPGAHVVLRGGASGPNYDAASVERARGCVSEAGLSSGIVVDCSHGNSRKDFRLQPEVARKVIEQLSCKADSLTGLMLESHLHSGNQALQPNPGAREKLDYGVSVTDGCIDFSTTETLLLELAGCA